MEPLFLLIFATMTCAIAGQATTCPSQELILPCRCLARGKEYQIWCSHSDLPRVLEGLRAVGQHISRPIDELILENNNLPSLPGKAFVPVKVMRLMLRYNSLERVSSGWLNGLENSLMELFVVEPELRSLPEESLQSLETLEAITIQADLLKRLPQLVNLPKLKYVQIESANLIELSSRNFKDLPALEKMHISGSQRLNRLEGGLLQDLPRLSLVNISYCGIRWIHMRAITRLPSLTELSLVGNKINDAGMIGRSTRELPALEILRLDYNSIDRLGEASFVDLPALKKLYLSNNYISELNHGAFHRVPLLRTLDLNKNHVRRVHPESFLQHSGSGLEELWLMNNEIEHVVELRSLLDALPRLTFLDMSYNNLEAIPYGALRGHPTLERLHLDYNKIHVIDREAFMAMPALRELRLKNNSLTDRLEMPFWNLPELKGLDLSGNDLRQIEPRLLSNIPSLRRIDLSQNEIKMVDPASFILTPDLEHVNLSYNALSTLHPATFRHLLNLYELDVSNNELMEFVPGLPRGVEYLHMSKNLIANIPMPPSPDLDLPTLKMVDLSSNEIQRIPPNAFRTFPQLRKLYIGKNSLHEIEENSLSGLNRLDILDMGENRITVLHPKSLKQTTKLSELKLGNNRIDLLIPDLFLGLTNLRKLDVSNNQLTEILPRTLEHLKDLEVIYATHNGLVNLPPGLYGMKKLRTLDLADNRLKNIHPDTLSSLISLQELRLSHNYVQDIQRGAFSNLPKLRLLYLDNNEIVNIESGAIQSLPALKTVKLSQNKLREIPNAAFTELPSLQMVELQENDLRLIGTNAFQHVPHLVMLNLSRNHIVGLEDAGLRSLRSLELLDMSNNQLSAVASPSLAKMEWLVELRLDNNRICSINGATFNGMPRLRVLSMRNNRMMSFIEQAVQKLRGNIAVLDIDGNPLACSCSILWLKAWLQEKSAIGPRCMDGTLLRDSRLSRQECEQEDRLREPVADGCEADLLSVPRPNFDTSHILGQKWFNKRNNRTKVPFEKNNVALSPEESEYFYDEYVDYPAFNESMRPNIPQKSNLSHYTSGDTPVIYAAANKNKTKAPDTPKGVVGSPSSSGFTFFGLPLPNLNLNNLLGSSSTRMDDKPQVSDTMVAERKAAIVNKPTRHQIQYSENHHVRRPPDLPEMHNIIGMMPPSHPEIQTGGFVPVLPGTGGFKPMIPKAQHNVFNITANIERINITQQSSATFNIPSTAIPIPAITPQIVQANKFPSSIPSTTSTTKRPFIINTTIAQETEDDSEYDDDEDEETQDTKDIIARITEIEQINNLSKILRTTKPPLVEYPATASDLEVFEDIFKEVVENVSIPESITSTEVPTTMKSNIENLVNFKNTESSNDLVTSFSNSEDSRSFNESQSRKEFIGTPLSALLIPGGQQPQFRPSGRPSITKVPSPHIAATAPLQADFPSSIEDDTSALPSNRIAKNGVLETTVPTYPVEDSHNWYFANYNKTNLEPYIGNGIRPIEGKGQRLYPVQVIIYLSCVTSSIILLMLY